jgi:L-glutamine-phosphate cytidylyltransferase
MRAIILAAGRGSRMGDLTDLQPKCFVRVRGRRLLDWQLSALRGAGIGEIGVVRGYRGEAFTEPLHYFDNPRWSETNMVASLMTAQAWLRADTCIVSYSDIFYSSAAIERLQSASADVAITYDPNWLQLWRRRFADPLSDCETFRLHADGTLREIGERAQSLDQIEGQYMGLLQFTPAGFGALSALLSELPALQADRLDMTSLLRRLIARAVPIQAIAIDDAWGEVDSRSDLETYVER